MSDPVNPREHIDHLAEQLADVESDSNLADSTLRDVRAELETLADQIREPAPDDEYADESALLNGLEAVAEIGVEPSTGTREAIEAAQASGRELRQLGSYELLEQIGQGGMGTVYKARHTSLDRVVALKLLPSERLRSPDAVDRFSREMKAIASLQNPHVVAAHDGGEVDGQHFLVMEFVAGIDLGNLSEQTGPLPVGAACELIRQAAEGLEYVHGRGTVHRDIKPPNLMLTAGPTGDPLVKILDLGLARVTGPDSGEDGTAVSELTADGQVMGTMRYMAPEQAADARSVLPAADLYSLGATLYRLLSGQVPFPPDRYRTHANLLTALATQTPPSIATLCNDLPPELVSLTDRLLSRDPSERPATAADVAAELATFARPDELRSLMRSDETAATTAFSPDISDPRAETVMLQATVSLEPPGTGSTPAASTPPHPRPAPASGRRWPVTIAVLLLAGFVGLYASGLIFKVKTPGGTLILECDPALLQGAEIVIDGQQVKLTDPRDGETLTIDVVSDTGELKITKPGFELFAKKFDLTRDGKRISVHLDPTEVATHIPIPTAPVARSPGQATAGATSPGPGSEAGNLDREVVAADCLRREDIDPYELKIAGMGDPEKAPKELVAILGDSRLRHWGAGQFGAVKFHPTKNQILSVAADLTLRVWDIDSGSELSRMDVTQSSAGLVISDDGLFAATTHTQLDFWDLEHQKLISRATTVGDVIALSPDGKKLAAASSSGDGAITVIEVPSRQRVWRIAGHGASVRGIAWSPDGKWIATHGRDGFVRLWNAESGEPQQALTCPASGESCVTFSPDSQLVVVHGTVLDVASGELVKQLDADAGGKPVFSPAGSFLIVGVTVFDTQSWEKLAEYPGVGTIADISPDARLLAFSDAPYGKSAAHIRIIDRETGMELHKPDTHASLWNTLDVSPDGSRLLTTNTDGTIHLWNTATRDVERILQPGQETRDSYLQAVFSPDGHRIACSTGRYVDVFDSATGSRLSTTAVPHGNTVFSVAFSPDGRTMTSICMNRTLNTWSTETGLRLSSKPNVLVGVLDYTPDGEFLLGCTRKSVGRTWVMRTHDSSIAWDADEINVLNRLRVPIHPSGQFVALRRHSDQGATADVIQTVDGNLVRSFQHEGGWLGGMAFSPNGTTLATAHGGKLYFWSLNAALGEEPLQKTITLHEPWGSIHDILYSPEGRHLFTLNGNGTVYVLRLAEGPAVDEATRARFAAPLPPREPDPVYTPAGDWAVEFNGKTTLGTGPYVPLDKSKQFTAESWVRDWTGNVFHTGDQGDPENSIWLHKDWNNGIRLNGGWERENGTVNEEQELWLSNTRSAGWMHLAMVYDGNLQRVFVNGELAGEQSAKRPGEGRRDHGFLIGDLPGLTANRAPGLTRSQMSQLRFSNTARYTEAFTPPTQLESDTATLALYHFNAGNGSVVRDLSPHARDLALKDHTWARMRFTEPEPPLDEILKETEWTPLVDETGKSLVGWEQTDEDGVITEATRDGLKFSGRGPRMVFGVPPLNHVVLRARLQNVPDMIAYLGMRQADDAMLCAELYLGNIRIIEYKSTGPELYASRPLPPLSHGFIELVARVTPTQLSVYINGEFVITHELKVPPGRPFIGVNGYSLFRNVDMAVLPDDE